MTLDILIKSLQAFLQNHKTVKRFRFDFEDQIDIFAELNSDYPLVFASPITSYSISNNSGYFGTQYSIKLTILDRMNEDRSNVFTILNESNNIINDIIIWFKNSGITITDDQYIIDDINDEYSHRLTGKSLIINFLVDAQTDCVYPVYDCVNGKFIIINSLGDEKMFVVPSGSEISHNLQDSDFELEIYDSNNNLVSSKDYDVPAFSTVNGSLVLDDAEVKVFVNGVLQDTVYIPPYDANVNIDIG